ncbi:hypothetical protein GCM10009527_092820 [Actinomadura nitritigenes]|uniref:CBS domain-containing protein n=1 Tax=Actinomadura nitritigenes TaxID=134602 RepID=A0ABS3QY20_9ACTN|nr:hypothetical protein [Actinomadura nitritigenes]MBO2438841.1 hypothetical protein [Actinomadura nitritigenes]
MVTHSIPAPAVPVPVPVRVPAAEDFWTDPRPDAAGLRVSDVMTPRPDHGRTWQPARAFLETVALTTRQSAFPVTDIDERPVGTVTRDQIAASPAAGDLVAVVVAGGRPAGIVTTDDVWNLFRCKTKP